MADGIQTLRGIQVGDETVAGTLVPATAIWPCVMNATHRMVPANLRPVELRGLMNTNHKTIQPGIIGEIHLDGYVSFEGISYALDQVFRNVTPSADAGTPIAYTRVWAPSNTAEDAPRTKSLEMSSAVGLAWAYNYAAGRSLQISGKTDDLVMWVLEAFAKTRVQQAKTPALTIPTIEDVLANLGVLYLDTAAGTLGATAYTGKIDEFSYQFEAYKPSKWMENTKFFTEVHQQGIAPSMTVVVKGDTAFHALCTTYHETAAALQLRLKWLGTLIHSTPDVYKTFQIDFAGIINDVSPWGSGDKDNVQTITLGLEGQYNTAAAFEHKITTITALATIP